MNRSPNGGARSALVLVVDEDPLVGEHIAAVLAARQIEALHVLDSELARRLAEHAGSVVVVLDDIVESIGTLQLLRALDRLGPAAPHVVLVRCEPEPRPPCYGLRVTMVAGERWLEDLASAVERALDATTSSSPPRLSHAR